MQMKYQKIEHRKKKNGNAKKMYQSLNHSSSHYRMPKSNETDYLLLNNKSIECPIADGLKNFHDDAT
jgi:hypothetical protein